MEVEGCGQTKVLLLQHVSVYGSWDGSIDTYDH